MINQESPKALGFNLTLHKDARRYIIAIFALFAITISWLSILDTHAGDYINGSISDAGIIYGISRLINASISVLQSGEVGIGVASVAIGESLDPINDLIERFSEVMTYSIASLALQKILLLIVKHKIFNVLVTLAGAALIASLFFKRGESKAIKTFSLLVIARVSLSIILLSNSAVDGLFLRAQIDSSKQNIQQLENSVRALTDKGNNSSSSKKDMQSDVRIVKLDKIISKLISDKSKINIIIEELNNKIQGLEQSKTNAKKAMSKWVPEIFSKDPAIIKANEQIKAANNNISKNKDLLEQIEDRITSSNDKQECILKRLNGESCSLLEGAKKYSNVFNNKITTISKSMTGKIDTFLSLMALMILKSILLPLLFWILLYKLSKHIWKSEFTLHHP